MQITEDSYGSAKKSFRYREKNDFTAHRLILDVYVDKFGDVVVKLKSRYKDDLGENDTRANDIKVVIPKETLTGEDNEYRSRIKWRHTAATSEKVATGEIKINPKNKVEIVHCGEYEE